MNIKKVKKVKKVKKNKDIVSNEDLKKGYVFLCLITILAMMFFAFNNSPLVERMGEDGGMYLLMGRNITEGGVLYRDLFDHKGPIIFFLNALPQLFIKGPLGVWILEVIFMAICLCLLYKIAYKLLKNNSAFIPPILYLFISCSLFNGGNYTEEYSNLFCIVALYIFVNWIESIERDISNRQALILGVSLAVVFFTRPNNIAIILCVMVYLFISILKKSSKKVLLYVTFCMIGIAIVSGIIMFYHIMQGTVNDMLYATILHNMNYCREGLKEIQGDHFILSTFRKWLLFIYAIIVYAIIKCLRNKDKKYAYFLIFSSIVILLSILISGREYKYYLLLATPIMALCFMLIFVHGSKELNRYLKKSWRNVVIFILILFGLDIFLFVNPVKIKENINHYKEASVELGSYIPKSDCDKVFGYNVPAMWYYLTDITPCYKYYTMQEWMAKTNPQIKENINEFVLEERPTWIITYDEAAGTNHELMDDILKNYKLIYKNQAGYLYKLNS